MKEKLKALRARSTQLALKASAVTAATVGSAYADLPAEATAAMTQTATDGAAMVGLGWAIAVGVTGGLVLIGIFKKTANKAT